MGGRRSAGYRAREVVGMYGDPDTTWGIAVEAQLPEPVDAARAQMGLRRLVERHPHLGVEPVVETVDRGAWEARRRVVVGAPYFPGGPQMRVALASDDGSDRRIVVGAHHGVCDGLGLLAVLQGCTGVPLHPLARGIGDRPAGGTFLGVSVARLVEALRHPPPRFESSLRTLVGPGQPAEELHLRTLPRMAVGTTAVCRALARMHGARHGRRPRDLPLIVVGASRRAPGTLQPDRQTAYLRFRVDPEWSATEARSAFGMVPPEPDFPETSARGLGPAATRLLRHRLGSTAVVSNLGVVEGGLRGLAMFPALSGPCAVAVGLASTRSTTTVSLRTRTSEFPTAVATDLLDQVVAELVGPSGQ